MGLLGKGKDKSISLEVGWFYRILLVSIPWTELSFIHCRQDSPLVSHLRRHDFLQQPLLAVSVPFPSLFLEMFKFHSILLLVLWLFFSTLFSRIFFSFFPLLAPSFVLLHTTTSFPVIVTLCIVVFGFIIGSKGEIDFSITGTVFGVCSSIFVSLNSIYTKKLMHIVDNNSWILCFYVWFFPFTRFYRITWTLASCLCLWLFTLKRTPFFNTFLFWVLLLSGVGWPWLAFLASWLVLLPFCRYCFIPLGRIDS